MDCVEYNNKVYIGRILNKNKRTLILESNHEIYIFDVRKVKVK